MEFMVYEECYEEGMEKIRRAALSREERTAVFYHFSLYWSGFSGKDFTRYFEEVGGFRWWYQWREWFDDTRRLVRKRIGEANEEIGTMEAIHKAMNYIREHMDREITLEELLRLTGMSKSHFSKHFKKITGKNTLWKPDSPYTGSPARSVIWMNTISEGFSGKEPVKILNSTVIITEKQ